MEEECIWNSLEIVKVIASFITPLIGGYIAYKLATIGKDLEKKQWSNRKIIEKRISFYDNVVPKLNDLYCYFHRVGNWKELNPNQIIEIKRILDREFHIYSHLFKNDVLGKYNNLMHNSFKIYTGSGKDALIKMKFNKRIILENWKSEYEELFIETEQVTNEEFNTSYSELIKTIIAELEITN